MRSSMTSRHRFRNSALTSPRKFEEITVRALEKRPVDRFPNASTLAAALQEVLHSLDTSEQLARGGRVLNKRARLRRAWIGLGSAVAIAAAVMFVKREFLVPEAEAIPAIAVVPLAGPIGSDGAAETRLAARMLATDLGESSHIRVLGSSALDDILRNHRIADTSKVPQSELRDIAKSAKLSHIVMLSLSRGESMLRGDVEILDVPRGRTVGTAREEKVGQGDLVSMIDPLAAKTRHALLTERQLASETDRPFGVLTSKSIQAVELFYQAYERDHQGDAIQALALYERAVEIDPGFVLAKLYRDTLVGGNATSIAPPEMANLSEFERLMIDAQNALSVGDFQRQLSIATEMLTLKPGDWVALNYKYVAEYFLGFYDRAVRTCELAIKDGYRGYFEHLFLNSAYHMSGQTTAETVELYRSLLSEDPTDAMMKFWLSVTLLSLNRDEEARKELGSAFQVYPDNAAMLNVLADTYVWRTGPDKPSDYGKGLECLRRLRDQQMFVAGDTGTRSEKDKDRDWLRYGIPFSFRLGEVHLAQGDAAAAVNDFQTSLLTSPGYYNAFYKLGVAYDLLGDRSQAALYLNKYVNVTELSFYDASALGRESTCAASAVCHHNSRPTSLADARERLRRLQ